jgi:2'-5' RNA ligase
MQNVKYSFSSVQVNLPHDLAQEIIKWGKAHIPEHQLFTDKTQGHLGREDEIHMTVLYGLHSESPVQTKELVAKTPPFPIHLAKIGIFSTNDEFDVVKINIEGDELKDLNARLAKNCQHTNRHGAYRPHVTIAYVKKGTAWKFDGNADFEGRSFLADQLIFSSRNGKKDRISLK